jgi:hypothetical protein
MLVILLALLPVAIAVGLLVAAMVPPRRPLSVCRSRTEWERRYGDYPEL